MGKLPTCWQHVIVMEFWKRHDTTDTMDFWPCQLVTDLLRGNWCNGFWPLISQYQLFLYSQWRPHSASLMASSGSLAGPANIAMVTGDMTVHDFTWALRWRRVISSYASQSVGRRLTAAKCASGPTSLGAGPSADALWNLTLFSRLQSTTLPSINVVNRRWARLLLGWVTAHWEVNHLGI